MTAWLSLPAFAADTGRGTSLPAQTTGQSVEQTDAERQGTEGRERSGAMEERDVQGEPETFREAPGAAPGATPRGGVAPGQQPYRAPGQVEPGTPGAVEGPATPEPGRRWGLILFVVALVGLGLLAFRRRGPRPPAP
ncbi:MAG: hypothetical protein HY554_06785 [Elusimicrobia bacterium]|nr:hypothetical protein [Elusimicrobiota bacterium]